MQLRLTDGSQYELLECKQECEPETNSTVLICTLSKEYIFEDIVSTLKKNEIAEIISILDDNGNFKFQSKDYSKVKSVVNDILTGTIKIVFTNSFHQKEEN